MPPGYPEAETKPNLKCSAQHKRHCCHNCSRRTAGELIFLSVKHGLGYLLPQLTIYWLILNTESTWNVVNFLILHHFNSRPRFLTQILPQCICLHVLIWVMSLSWCSKMHVTSSIFPPGINKSVQYRPQTVCCGSNSSKNLHQIEQILQLEDFETFCVC